MQCFWKNKVVFVEQPTSALSLVVLPNIFIFNILLPLTYPFADSALLFGILLGDWQSLVLPFALFTAFDMAYAGLGLLGEGNLWRVWGVVPLQRVIYRQLLYYTVAKSAVRALEGVGSGWNKFIKIGETQRFYFSSATASYSPQEIPEEVTTSFQGPSGMELASTNRQEVKSLSTMPRQFQSAGETSNPAWTPNVLTGTLDEPNTYEKSFSPFGPTSSN